MNCLQVRAPACKASLAAAARAASCTPGSSEVSHHVTEWISVLRGIQLRWEHRQRLQGKRRCSDEELQKNSKTPRKLHDKPSRQDPGRFRILEVKPSAAPEDNDPECWRPARPHGLMLSDAHVFDFVRIQAPCACVHLSGPGAVCDLTSLSKTQLLHRSFATVNFYHYFGCTGPCAMTSCCLCMQFRVPGSHSLMLTSTLRALHIL